MEDRIDKAIEILEYIMEEYDRTFNNQDSENAWICNKVHEAIMMLKFGRNKI